MTERDIGESVIVERSNILEEKCLKTETKLVPDSQTGQLKFKTFQYIQKTIEHEASTLSILIVVAVVKCT